MQEKMVHFDWPVIGHESVIEYLQKSIINNKLSHAYLFIGSEHVGKSLVAENLICCLQCENNDKKSRDVPCQKCSACEQVKKRIHPDVYFIEKLEDKKNISIEQIRELEHKLSMRSFLTAYKIAVINEAEKMTIEAFNSLLKTLEEPTPKTIIIIIASKLNQIPSTILSRCQVLKFNLISNKKILNYLVKLGKSKKEAQEITSLSQGRPGLAISYIQDNVLLENYQDKIDDVLKIINGSVKEKFNIIDKIIPKRMSINEINESLVSVIDIWSYFFRDLILIKSENLNNITNIFIKNKLIILANKYKVEHLYIFLKKIDETKKLLSQNINPKLLLENLVINL